jgi:hypothetical protein
MKNFIFIFQRGVNKPTDDLLLRQLIFQVDSLVQTDGCLEVEVLDRDKLKGLNLFRPQRMGALGVRQENGDWDFQYFKFVSMQAERSICGKPTRIKFFYSPL